jgi:DDE superfamily endonuclease/Archaeal putative transposase ISC1217
VASIVKSTRWRKAVLRQQRKQQRRRRRQTKTHQRRQRPHRRPASLPQRVARVIGGVLQLFAVAFTRPTYKRFVVLLLAAILATGSRTILNLLRTVGDLAPGDPSSYHRVFAKRRWSLWHLGRALAGFILARWVPEGPVQVAGDDTVAEHKGKKVYGKACHRDAVRSSHSFTAYRWGHKWVVLAILVQFPFAKRPWALPVLCALYCTAKEDEKHGRRHKTPAELMRQLLAVLCRWFPKRCFVFVGDGGFGVHPLASFVHRHRRRLTLVSRFYKNANLYDLPPAPTGKKKNGRPRKKGVKLPSPEDVVAKTPRKQRLRVSWYGGGQRDIAVVTGTGHWYKGGEGLVPVRWVYVHDRTGTHRDDYFFSTDVDLSAQEIVETYTRRWNLETTFQEMRGYLKLEKTRGWTEHTVLRTAPCLFGLYAVIAVFYAELPVSWQRQRAVTWRDKAVVTFSDAITAVRRWLWAEWVFATPDHSQAFAKIPRRLQATLLDGLAPAA